MHQLLIDAHSVYAGNKNVSDVCLADLSVVPDGQFQPDCFVVPV
jgi:hypothetical protein